MFGFSVRCIQNGDNLRVVIPAPPLIVFMCLLGLFIFYKAWRGTTTPRGNRTGILSMAACVLALGVFFSPASVELDGQTNTAHINTMMLFIPHRRVVPLSYITNASIRNADFSSAIILSTSDNRAIQLTPYGQMGSVDQGANAINDFLSSHNSHNKY
jgi:hypothetical protein